MGERLLHPRYPGDLDEQGVVPIGLPVRVGEVDDPASRHLLLGFESLGEDCEFGLVQRRYAAETLSLFRWMTTPNSALLDLLGSGFDGLGDPAQTEIRAAPWGELMAFDLKYDMKMHSFVHKSGVDLVRFARNQSRRILFLKRKLLDDLKAHEKIFVVHAGTAMTDDLARRIATALRSYGPNALLAVGPASAEHRPGTVTDHGDGLLRGYIDRPGKTAAPGGHRWDINFDAWLALCRGSADLVAGVMPVRASSARTRAMNDKDEP